jgi:GntR family transcriptional regulator
VKTDVISLRSDRRPLYVRAVDALYDLIEMGGFAPGQPLPAEDVLAGQLGISRSTLREALGHLEKDGAVTRRQGVGTFIAPRATRVAGGLERLQPFREVASLAGAQVEVLSRWVDAIPTPPEIASALAVPAATAIFRLRAVEAIDGCKVAYLEGYISPNHADRSGLEKSTGSLLEYLIDQPHLNVAYARSEISTAEAGLELSASLEVPPGKPLLCLVEVVFSDDDTPIAYFRNYFVTECYSLKVVRRIVRHAKSRSAA